MHANYRRKIRSYTEQMFQSSSWSLQNNTLLRYYRRKPCISSLQERLQAKARVLPQDPTGQAAFITKKQSQEQRRHGTSNSSPHPPFPCMRKNENHLAQLTKPFFEPPPPPFRPTKNDREMVSWGTHTLQFERKARWRSRKPAHRY